MNAIWIVLLAIVATLLALLSWQTAQGRSVRRQLPYAAAILGVALLLGAAVFLLLR